MQWQSNGPDIPNELLHALEENQVVFFCGAGISYPAGLPGFEGLVDKIYEYCGTCPSENSIEQKAYDEKRFDNVLELLERRLPGQHLRMREALFQSLQFDGASANYLETHEALLKLAQSKDGSFKLVTTNFDRLFSAAANKLNFTVREYTAPMLPIPKNSHWNDGIVYLHGQLPEHISNTELQRLVVTSGDFGLAYLNEGWAARFVSELFRNYTVCFIGYSIDDPILRYMMDALAADRRLGESTNNAYSLASSDPKKEEKQNALEWEAKGVTPIFYDPDNRHEKLHTTLKLWANTWSKGTYGKEQLVTKLAIAHPSGSTQEDNFVGRMLWALSDKSGMPAKAFSKVEPTPSLDWLDVMSSHDYEKNDLPLFGITGHQNFRDDIKFSLVRRPSPSELSPWINLVHQAVCDTKWDKVIPYLADWLTLHLNNPNLILWVVNYGGQLHERFSSVIEQKLEYYSTLRKNCDMPEIESINKISPDAIPSEEMIILWRLLLADKVKTAGYNIDIYKLTDNLKLYGYHSNLRSQIRKALSPKVKFNKAYAHHSKSRCLKDSIDWDLTLNSDSVKASIDYLDKDLWKAALPNFLDDFQISLCDLLDLQKDLGDADERSSLSNIHQPSISKHSQNKGFQDWTILIELLRDAWLEKYKQNNRLAQNIAEQWFEMPYPVFKRLAFFAASQNNCIQPQIWLNWLLDDDSWWLWSSETLREVMQLLVLQSDQLKPRLKQQLEKAILAGPNKEWFRSDVSPAKWESIRAHSIWLRLEKLHSSYGLNLKSASKRRTEIAKKYPDYKVYSNQKEEFSWWSGDDGLDQHLYSKITPVPKDKKELKLWLKNNLTVSDPKKDDDWRKACETSWLTCLWALCKLGEESGQWPVDCWKPALHEWSSKNIYSQIWNYLSEFILNKMPDDNLRENKDSIGRFVREASKNISINDPNLLPLCTRLLAIRRESPESGNDHPLASAINNLIGHTTKALLNSFFNIKPKDDDGLPDEIKKLFTLICEDDNTDYYHGRTILCANIIALFRIDFEWTDKYLLPLFSWSNKSQAASAWSGFLWSPRLYVPLFTCFKEQFLETADHYYLLKENPDQYAIVLTHLGLESMDDYSNGELRKAMVALPTSGLKIVARTLSRSLENAGDSSNEFWKKNVAPFWQNIWPQNNQLASADLTSYIALIAINSGDEFPNAFMAIQYWLKPIDDWAYIVRQVLEKNICSKWPKVALSLLSKIVDLKTNWAPGDLNKCLNSIIEADSSLKEDYNYIKLSQ